MHRWVVGRRHTPPVRRSSVAHLLLTALAIVAIVASPVASQALADPDLDSIMKLTPAGFTRAEGDRLPAGPMTAATFDAVSVVPVPTRDDSSVFYGASYERSDGALIVFLGMSSSRRADGQTFADGVARTLTEAKPFVAGIDDVTAVEGESNGVRTVAIAFARNGRGFAVLSFGENARAEASNFVDFVVEMADSTPPRSDAQASSRLRPAAVAVAATVALAVAGMVTLLRFARRRIAKSRGLRSIAKPDARSRHLEAASRRIGPTETFEHTIVTAPEPPRSPRPTPRQPD
jgi:hypothetical protein